MAVDYSDPGYAAWALQNPATTREALAYIAQAHPGLRDRVATHANAYPQLVAWIAAQSTSSAPAPVPQPHGPASAPAQPYGSPQPGHYGNPAPYDAPTDYAPGPQPGAPPYYGPGGYPPPKKKTGLVVGLVGGAVVLVVAVAALGIFVFGWFGDGGSPSSGPVLTKSQTEAFLDSGFMQDLSGGTSVSSYRYGHRDSVVGDGAFECEGLMRLSAGSDSWTTGDLALTRFPDTITPDAAIEAEKGCEGRLADDLDRIKVHSQGGGWWVRDNNDGSLTLIYGNLWLTMEEPVAASDSQRNDLFASFAKAADAAAKQDG